MSTNPVGASFSASAVGVRVEFTEPVHTLAMTTAQARDLRDTLNRYIAAADVAARVDEPSSELSESMAECDALHDELQRIRAPYHDSVSSLLRERFPALWDGLWGPHLEKLAEAVEEVIARQTTAGGEKP